MTEDQEREFQDLAEEVALDGGPGPRVEPIQIAKANGITFSFNNYGSSFDGMLRARERAIPHLLSQSRKRLTLADCAPVCARTLPAGWGHSPIDPHRQALANGTAPAHGSRCEYESKLLVEREADHFASCLLMPEQRFSAEAKKKRGLPAVLKCVKTFGTSVTSTAIRYVLWDPAGSAVVKWDANGRQWMWISPLLRTKGYRALISRRDQIPAGSATDKALRGLLPASKGYCESGTTAAGWFPTISQGHSKNVIMIEQALELGRYGVLTLLYPES